VSTTNTHAHQNNAKELLDPDLDVKITLQFEKNTNENIFKNVLLNFILIFSREKNNTVKNYRLLNFHVWKISFEASGS
jgi:hypothetical protein